MSRWKFELIVNIDKEEDVIRTSNGISDKIKELFGERTQYYINGHRMDEE